MSDVIASQELANSVYRCVESEAHNRENIGSSIQAVAGACSLLDGKGEIKVIKARLDNDTTHLLKLTDGKQEYLFSFNIVGTNLRNEEKKKCATKGVLNSLIVDLEDVEKHLSNSKEANTCKTKDQEDDYHNSGFGFEKVGNICKRKCVDGKVLKGQRVPIIYRDGDSNFFLTGLKSAGTEIFLDTQCVPCPKGNSPNEIRYTETHPSSNKCYDSDGCEEGYHHIPSISEAENLIGYMPNIKNPKKACLPVCDETQVLGSNGICHDDPKKSCRAYKDVNNKIDNWLTRFFKISETSKFGTCDINLIRKEAAAWAQQKKIGNSKFLASGCDPTQYTSMESFGMNFSNNRKFQKCLMDVNKGGEYDASIYILMHEEFYNPDKHPFEVYW
jgi:hypothetical protein